MENYRKLYQNKEYWKSPFDKIVPDEDEAHLKMIMID
jgi:hypothetical protein